MRLTIPAHAVFALIPIVPPMIGCGSSFIGEPTVSGSGAIVSETRSVPEFEEIEIGGAFETEIVVGPRQSLVITGDDNLLLLVQTRVHGRTLEIESDENLDPTDEIRIEISTPSLSAVRSSGSSDLRISGVKAPTFLAEVAGSGEIIARGDFGDLTTSIGGSGEITMSGTAERVAASVAGSGELDLYELAARAADVRVSGSGDVRIWASDSLDASVSGSGDVHYRGNPRVQRSVSGSGNISGPGGRGT